MRFYAVGSGRQLQAIASAFAAGSASFNVNVNGDLIFANTFSACQP